MVIFTQLEWHWSTGYLGETGSNLSGSCENNFERTAQEKQYLDFVVE